MFYEFLQFNILQIPQSLLGEERSLGFAMCPSLTDQSNIDNMQISDKQNPHDDTTSVRQDKANEPDSWNYSETYKEKSLIVPLCKSIVRSHLAYCIQAWGTYLRKDVDMFAKMQRKAIKFVPGLSE